MKMIKKIVACVSLLTLMNTTFAIPTKPQESEEFPLADVQRFSTALSQIKHYYVKKVEDKKLFESAIRGMVTGLDPHSDYLNEDDFEALTTSSRGNFGGLGIEVTMENGVIKVVSPIDDTPAFRAGLKAGDYIIALDQSPVRGMSLKDAVGKMRGKKGEPIDLTIVRKSSKKPLKFKVVRDIIKIKSVSSKLYEQKYGYLRIKHFQEPTARDVKKSVKFMTKKAGGKLAGLVIDLRNNPGGLLDSAIEISDFFINNPKKAQKKKLIVYTEGRVSNSRTSAYATPGDIMKGAPVVILINEGSASGSEIVAGALKDNKRAVLIGKKTFGKGSVQTVLPLDEKHAIKLTTALYYTPSGISIQAQGIKPDIDVEPREIPKKKENEFKIISEADLLGHIKNKKQTKSEKEKKIREERFNLLYSDYQLHEALNLLKGMDLANKTTI